MASLELTVVRCGKSTIAWVLCVSRVSIIRVDLFGISADPISKSAPPLPMIGSQRGVVSTRPQVGVHVSWNVRLLGTQKPRANMLAASAPLPSHHI